MVKTVKIIEYSKREEQLNFITHFSGAILGLIGGIWLFIKASRLGELQVMTACGIYGLSMIILYTMSGTYHAVKGDTIKRLFRIMDHNTIFVLIAGTYTPYTLIALKGTVGWLLFAAEWLFALLGIVLNTINLEKFKVFSLVCYVAMGWAALLAIKPLINSLGTGALIFLIAGGVAYTAGIYFYGIKKPYYHAIWHLFVLLGSVLQFISVSLIF